MAVISDNFAPAEADTEDDSTAYLVFGVSVLIAGFFAAGLIVFFGFIQPHMN